MSNFPLEGRTGSPAQPPHTYAYTRPLLGGHLLVYLDFTLLKDLLRVSLPVSVCVRIAHTWHSGNHMSFLIQLWVSLE